ncbi:LCM-domain-containing protein [Penicillium macrosclerotiorum]|uniref:LCM-domain-containing protein n=1 Tax=Penicillium macrosclerotiorum TaxID=303699 RepID=UPI0025496611|nr:LCM-domain-containing protein [Penicillium macrosclerotiorum]KAJ5690296.1 LCM-domain-containing protein [Penicillium macrosclerotiorum]
MAASRPAMSAASKAEKNAEVVMGTNNSSIISKRSVEMIYYPKPHFFRYFVKKPQRRSPTINRGYWLRMHAMAQTVRQFMENAPADKPKFVLNLGCGYDSLPFVLLSEEKKSGHAGNTIFVDIDYEKLILYKRDTIRKTREITEVLGDVEFGQDQDAIQIRSSQYIAVGCDLKNLKKLDDVLRTSILPDSECPVLFLAEMSLTYMPIPSANAVLSWASQLTNDVQFCLLEKYFPDGPNHPYAKGMMLHYENLKAPLFSTNEYPSLAEQEQRFRESGWSHARAQTLWDLWSNSPFLVDSVRIGLDSCEAFDEWEELALFASHFFLLIASTKPGGSPGTTGLAGVANETEVTEGNVSPQFVLQGPLPTGQGCGRRRYGAWLPDGPHTIGHHGGQGEQARLATTDLYSRSDVAETVSSFPSRDIPTRMCHTITALGKKGDCILIGGRASPTAPLNDCWLRQDNTWCQVHPLPEARFRHSATDVSLSAVSTSILVYGGKTKNNTILESWILWNDQDQQGWRNVRVIGSKPEARFGACFAKTSASTGVLFGGIGYNATILEDFWTWSLLRSDDGSLEVELTDVTKYIRTSSPQLFPYLSRFGATVNATSQGLVVAGGIIPRRLIPAAKEILLLDSTHLASTTLAQSHNPNIITAIGLGAAFAGPRPLLTGHVACTIDSDHVLFVGGGAVCFPTGTVWTEGAWILHPADSNTENTWGIVAPKKKAAEPIARKDSMPMPQTKRATLEEGLPPSPIPRVRIESAAQFEQIVANGKPVVIEGADIGPCTTRWTKEYLACTVGEDRKVVVHEAQSEQMSFQTKNFAYVTKCFGSFLDEVHAGGRQYLRSISAEQPSKMPAHLEMDFPTLQDDFRLPDCMAMVTENAHSSPLRISGPVTMWLHYDVMANVLCQVRGERRLILFPPDDVQALHLPPGASSSRLDIFAHAGLDTAAARIPGTHPQEAILRPGEILFLPPLWLHTACSAASAVSVAVNVFFRNLAQGYATGRDVYGNRDLQAYEKGRLDLQKVKRSFAGVPPDMARFYLRRLAQELQELADQ